MNFEEALVMFSLSAGISLVSSSGACTAGGQGVKQVQWGWWHHPETNYPRDPEPSFLH